MKLHVILYVACDGLFFIQTCLLTAVKVTDGYENYSQSTKERL